MANSNNYMNEYMKKRYKKKRDDAIIFLGGKCVKCSGTQNLQFDHIDMKEKEFGVAKIMLHSKEKLYKELSKCQLLCSKCHGEKTLDEMGLEDARKTHGTLSSYRYCRCDECRKAKSDWQREYSRKRKRKMRS